jgi:hypothetical protein
MDSIQWWTLLFLIMKYIFFSYNFFLVKLIEKIIKIYFTLGPYYTWYYKNVKIKGTRKNGGTYSWPS